MSSLYDRGCLRLQPEWHLKGSTLHTHVFVHTNNDRENKQDRKRGKEGELMESSSLKWSLFTGLTDKKRGRERPSLNTGRRKRQRKKQRNSYHNSRNVSAFTGNFCHDLKKEKEHWCAWQQRPLNQTYKLQQGGNRCKETMNLILTLSVSVLLSCVAFLDCIRLVL